ncbi:unnamed protein product [Durusdinium trenchii]|uniref:Uncharacterized protein n=1 Tax=Durusdinium trenchii TaxID=1381693 RepID=A0ABP0R3M3_9DINO
MMRTLILSLLGLLEASVLEEKVLESVASGAVHLALDGSGTVEQVEVPAERPFWKKAKKYDDDVEKSLEAANLTQDERQEVEKNLDDLLNHTNITLYQEWGVASLVQIERPNHTVALRNHSSTVSVKGTDPRLKALNEQHDNLTRLVHSQADVVAHTSANLAKNNEEIDKQELEVAHAGDLYNKAHADTLRAEKAFKDHMVALAIAKKRRDDLRRKAEEARKVLEQVGPQANAAEYHLNILMSRTPGLKEHAKSKDQDEDKMADYLEAEEKKAKDMQIKLTGDDSALQAAIVKLNGLNSDLKRIEEKIIHWNGEARPLAMVPVALVSLLLGFHGQL